MMVHGAKAGNLEGGQRGAPREGLCMHLWHVGEQTPQRKDAASAGKTSYSRENRGQRCQSKELGREQPAGTPLHPQMPPDSECSGPGEPGGARRQGQGQALPPCIFPTPERRSAHGRASAAGLGRSCGTAPQRRPRGPTHPAQGSGSLGCPQSSQSRGSAGWI